MTTKLLQASVVIFILHMEKEELSSTTQTQFIRYKPMSRQKNKRKRWLKRHGKHIRKQIFNKAWRDHFVRKGILSNG